MLQFGQAFFGGLGVLAREIRRRPVISGQHGAKLWQAAGHDFEHGLLALDLHFLRQVCDPNPGPDPDLAVIGRGFPADQFHQRGLAFAIAANQAHPLRRMDFQRDLVQQGPVPIGKRDFVEANEWHGSG